MQNSELIKCSKCLHGILITWRNVELILILIAGRNVDQSENDIHLAMNIKVQYFFKVM